MEIIIATSNVDFGNKLKAAMQKEDVEVKELVTCVEDLVEALRKNPKVNGVILKTDLAKKLNDAQLELLADVVYSIRLEETFSHLVFTIISDYKAGHPLLAEFLEMGIYNFYVRDEAHFTVANLVETIRTPMSFSMALKYRKVSTDIPWRRNLTKPQMMQVKFDKEEVEQETPKGVPEDSKPKKPNFFEKLRNVKKTTKLPPVVEKQVESPTETPIEKPIETPTETPIEPEWDFSEVQVKKAAPIIGTVLISVASVRSHLGSTTTALSLGNFLKDQGYKVAVVEANESLDFDRIHSLSEGETIHLNEPEFVLQGLKHIKYRGKAIDLGTIYTSYQYVILDMGYYNESPFKDEFSKSHFKFILSSSDEWKYYWTEEFLLNCNATENITFLIPGAIEKSVSDFNKQFKQGNAYAMPILKSPYAKSKLSDDLFDELLDSYKLVNHSKTDKKTLLAMSLIGAIVTAIGFSMFLLLN